MATQPVPEYESDPVIYRIVVGVLGALVIIVALGAFVLMMFDGKDVTQGVLALGSAAVGGLVGVLIPTPIARKNNAP
jgi:hypothetical protein